MPDASGYVVEQASCTGLKETKDVWVREELHHRVKRRPKGNYFYRVKATDEIHYDPGNVEQVQILFTARCLKIALPIIVVLLTGQIVWVMWMIFYSSGGSIDMQCLEAKSTPKKSIPVFKAFSRYCAVNLRQKAESTFWR